MGDLTPFFHEWRLETNGAQRGTLWLWCGNISGTFEGLIMKYFSSITIAILVVLMTACSSDNKDSSVVPAGPLSTLEKAKGTEKMMQEAEEKRRQEMEAQQAN